MLDEMQGESLTRSSHTVCVSVGGVSCLVVPVGPVVGEHCLDRPRDQGLQNGGI